MIRALVIASIEYILAVVVLWKGKMYPKICAAILFFLASYQLGELILFATNGHPIGIQVAYFSTTMLPPLGLLLVERVTGKKFGSTYFFGAALFFAVCFVLVPDFVGIADVSSGCCIRTYNSFSFIRSIWGYYYMGTLMYTMILMAICALTTKLLAVRKTLIWLFVAYASFYFVSIAIAVILPEKKATFASLMCALAIGAAIIIAALALTTKASRPGAREKNRY